MTCEMVRGGGIHHVYTNGNMSHHLICHIHTHWWRPSGCNVYRIFGCGYWWRIVCTFVAVCSTMCSDYLLSTYHANVLEPSWALSSSFFPDKGACESSRPKRGITKFVVQYVHACREWPINIALSTQLSTTTSFFCFASTFKEKAILFQLGTNAQYP